MIIYYGIECPINIGLRFESPHPVKIYEEFSQDEQTHNFNLCPAYAAHNKNLFYVPALFDYNLWYDKENNVYQTSYYDQEVFNNFIRGRVLRLKLLSFNMYVHILTESDNLELSQLPAYLHPNQFTRNSVIIPGTFNIGKWPRPLDVAFYLLDKIEIKEGEPLYYIKFNTKESINFKRFIVTERYKKYTNDIILASRKLERPKIKKLSYFYNLINNAPKLKIMMLEEAKSNLLE